MARDLLHASAWVALCLATLTAGAQTVRGGRPDPLDATADVPRTSHESAFKAYRRLGDTPPTPWKQANETVERIGGWRAYAREAEYTEDEALTRIVDMFEAEINRPTDMGSTTPRSQQGH